MDIKPVKHTEKPKYPLKTEIKEEELKKRIPKRWTANPAAKIALGTLAVVSLAGCAPEVLAGVEEAVIPPTEASVSVTPTQVMPEGTPVPAMINVAPLFVHGEGRGSCGCLMVAPPVFLSEDEALVVINEVAKDYGLEFTSGGAPEFNNVLQPQTNLSPLNDEGSISTTSTEMITLKTDFVDNSNNIAIEYVSKDDVILWGKPSDASVDVYETKDAADQLSDSLEKAAGFGYTAGVMYDPCETYGPENLLGQEEWDQEKWNAAWKEAEAKAREMSEEQLRKQAKDFFEWLKSQGVI